MTEFKEDFNKREVDPRIIIRSCMFYYNQLDKHLKNVIHLSQETIKYYTERILEATLFLEEYANQIYDELSEEEKEILKLAETKRNERLYTDSAGSPLSPKDINAIKTCIDTSNNRYTKIHEEAEDRTNKNAQSEI